jgi:hypothetical protein
MVRAVGDPDSIKQLGRKVKQASEEMEKIAQGLVRALKATDWDDEVSRRFERDLDQLVRNVRSFKGLADAAEQQMQKKARDLETYLRR